MTMVTYRLYGLTVRSTVALPAEPVPSYEGPVDVEVSWDEPRDVADGPPPGRRVMEFVERGRCWYSASVSGDDYVLRFHGAAEFTLDRGLTSIRCAVGPGTQPDVVPVLLAGTVLAFLLMLRGRGIMHASAVDVDGRAIAFVGHSGMGKSTCAALLCAVGGRLITDDVLALDAHGASATCHRGATKLRLRSTSAAVLDAFAVVPSTEPTVDGRTAVTEPPTASERVPLAAIVVPRPRRGREDVLATRLPPADALCELLRFPRAGRWLIDEPDVRQFELLARIVEATPVFIVDVPWGPPFRREVAEGLLSALGIERASVEA